MPQKFIQEPCLEHPWGRLKFWEGSCGKESGESSPENMLMDSYLGVQQVVTCKGQTLKTKKCKWDMLAQCSLPRRTLCRTSFEGDGWSLGSQLSWLQTTDLLLEDWGGPVLTTTPCIIDILQARHLLEIAGDSLWNVFPAPWQVLSATHKNTVNKFVPEVRSLLFWWRTDMRWLWLGPWCQDNVCHCWTSSWENRRKYEWLEEQIMISQLQKTHLAYGKGKDRPLTMFAVWVVFSPEKKSIPVSRWWGKPLASYLWQGRLFMRPQIPGIGSKLWVWTEEKNEKGVEEK